MEQAMCHAICFKYIILQLVGQDLQVASDGNWLSKSLEECLRAWLDPGVQMASEIWCLLFSLHSQILP